MKYSIITVVRNNIEMIKDCVESVSSQQDINCEHIIQDAESTDGTLEYLEGLLDQHLKLVSEKDAGIYDGLNRGMKRASGDIIGILHSDDIFSDTSVLRNINCYFEKGDDIVYADLEYVSRTDLNNVFRRWTSGSFNKSNLRQGWMPPHPTVFFKKSLLEKIGYYETSFLISADYDFILKLFQLEDVKIGYLPKSIVKMRVGGTSNKSLHNLKVKMKEDYEVMRKNFKFPLICLLLKNIRKISQIKISYFKLIFLFFLLFDK